MSEEEGKEEKGEEEGRGRKRDVGNGRGDDQSERREEEGRRR